MYILMINNAITCSSFYVIFRGLLSKRNDKTFPSCFYRVIETLVKVWENSKKLRKPSPAARVLTAFLVLPNFPSCFYNSIQTRKMFSISQIFLLHVNEWYACLEGFKEYLNILQGCIMKISKYFKVCLIPKSRPAACMHFLLRSVVWSSK